MRVMLLSLLAVLLGAAGLARAQEQPPAPVVVRTAEKRMLAPMTWYPGTVISRNAARIAAEVEGRLKWVADVGTVVSQGEEVARIDDVLLRQELAEAQAAVARERARLKYLEAEVARLTQLVKKNSVTESQLDEAVANRGVTKSELAADIARLELVRERLDRTALRAPFHGVVTERLAQAGEWAEAGTAVVRLVDTRSLEVQVWVPVDALKYVRKDSSLTLSSNPHESRVPVRTIVPVGDNRSRLYELRLTVDADAWPVGQDVRVAVPTSEAREVVAIPRDALVVRRDGTYVYRIDEEGKAERVSVSTGIAVGDLIAVDNIRPGDRVVTRGGERLREGQKVQIIEPEG